jgi:hypothetical protein
MRNVSLKPAVSTFWVEGRGSRILWNSSAYLSNYNASFTSCCITKHKRVVLLFACKNIGLEQGWQITGTDAKFGTCSKVTRHQWLRDFQIYGAAWQFNISQFLVDKKRQICKKMRKIWNLKIESWTASEWKN